MANGSSKVGTTSRAGWEFLTVLFKLADERAILAKVNANSYSSSCFSSTPVIKVVAQMKNLREGVVLLLRALPSQETCLLLSFVWRRMLLEDEQRLVRSDDSINIPVFPMKSFSTYTIFLPFLHFLNSPTQQLTKPNAIPYKNERMGGLQTRRRAARTRTTIIYFTFSHRYRRR